MKLYYSPGACSLACHIVAREVGYSPELEKVNLAAKKTESGEDYLKINPKGYVPALALDSGEVLTEVAIICQYLADQKPEAGLLAKFGTMERYHQLEALNFAATELHQKFNPLFNPKVAPELKEVLVATVERRIGALENLIGEKEYVAGNNYTIADAYLFTVLNWTKTLNIDLNKWPIVKTYRSRIAARPKVQEALKAEGLVK
jgi:glutathione S-transferase